MNLLLLIRISGFINFKSFGSKQHLLLHILTKKDLNILAAKMTSSNNFFLEYVAYLFQKLKIFSAFKASGKFTLFWKQIAGKKYFLKALKCTHCYFFQHAIKQNYFENTDEHVNLHVTCLLIAHNLQIKMKSAHSTSHNKSRIWIAKLLANCITRI